MTHSFRVGAAIAVFSFSLWITPLFGEEVGEDIWRTAEHDAINCLSFMLECHGIGEDYSRVKSEVEKSAGEDGRVSLGELGVAARRLGLQCKIVRLTPQTIARHLPAIVVLERDISRSASFNILLNTDSSDTHLLTGDTVRVVSFAPEEVWRVWTGHAVIIAPEREVVSWQAVVLVAISIVVCVAVLYCPIPGKAANVVGFSVGVLLINTPSGAIALDTPETQQHETVSDWCKKVENDFSSVIVEWDEIPGVTSVSESSLGELVRTSVRYARKPGHVYHIEKSEYQHSQLGRIFRTTESIIFGGRYRRANKFTDANGEELQIVVPSVVDLPLEGSEQNYYFGSLRYLRCLGLDAKEGIANADKQFDHLFLEGTDVPRVRRTESCIEALSTVNGLQMTFRFDITARDRFVGWSVTDGRSFRVVSEVDGEVFATNGYPKCFKVQEEHSALPFVGTVRLTRLEHGNVDIPEDFVHDFSSPLLLRLRADEDGTLNLQELPPNQHRLDMVAKRARRMVDETGTGIHSGVWFSLGGVILCFMVFLFLRRTSFYWQPRR